jgi:hypothetical protein
MAQKFYKLDTHRAAIDHAYKHIKAFTIPWLGVEPALSYSYEEVTSNPQKLISDLAEVLNIPVSSFTSDHKICNLLDDTNRVYN